MPDVPRLRKTVLRTKKVADAIQEHGVVMLKADWSHKAKALEVTKMLDILGSNRFPSSLSFRRRIPTIRQSFAADTRSRTFSTPCKRPPQPHPRSRRDKQALGGTTKPGAKSEREWRSAAGEASVPG